MNNKAIWVVGAIIVIAIGAYLVMGRDKTGSETAGTTPANSEVAGTENSAAPATKESSLKSLLALGTSQKCTYSDNGSEGTFYVAKGKSRGDFTTTAAGQTTKGHMIADGKDTHIWMDGQSTGFIMSFESAMENQQADTSAKTPEGVDLNKNRNYKCESWSEDSSVFVLPSNINFVSMSSMMKDPKALQDSMKNMKPQY